MAPSTFCQCFHRHHHLALHRHGAPHSELLACSIDDDTEWLLTCKKTLATELERKNNKFFFLMHMSVKQIDCAGSSIDFQWSVQYRGLLSRFW